MTDRSFSNPLSQAMRFLIVTVLVCPLLGEELLRADLLSPISGEAIYAAQCASCHGPHGEGVAEEYDEPLEGSLSLERLTRKIIRSMPEQAPEECVGDEAAAVAEYIYQAFYSPEARATSTPTSRLEVCRLTVPQYRNSVADLVGSFQPSPPSGTERGLEAHYYKARNFKREDRVLSRVDERVDFAFGDQSPALDQIKPEEFSIQWRGSVLAEETGDYQFIVRSENGVRLWVNDPDKAVIDGWVRSGTNVTEHAATVRLLAGRAYPIRLDYFKFKEDSASIALCWKPPHQAMEVIPHRCLTPEQVAPLLVVTTPFPPDDRSAGYERGTSVSAAWDEATTYAAIEVANYVTEHLNQLAKTKVGAADRESKLRRFCGQFAETAFRRPLSDEQKEFFVNRRFDQASDPVVAVKQVVLLTLKSPRFLYPELGEPPSDQYARATRLAYALWDSLPDRALTESARKGQLGDPERVTQQARRMLRDPRSKAKLDAFFAYWLQIEHAGEIAKDSSLFPGFDEAMVSDLRTSLRLFLDDVLWSGDGSYQALFLSPDLYLNNRLAAYYGAESLEHQEFDRVDFTREGRAGVVTHPYMLAVHAYHNTTSPIHRGVFLTRNVMGRPLKPPPMAIEFSDNQFPPDLTMREKVTELTRPASCQSCHSVINPLGFSLEHFDAVGRYRESDGAHPIDSQSDYETVAGKTVILKGARDVAEWAAQSEEARHGFVGQLFHFMIKQPATAYGPGTLARLSQQFEASGCRIPDLLVDIACVSTQPDIKPIKDHELAHFGP